MFSEEEEKSPEKRHTPRHPGRTGHVTPRKSTNQVAKCNDKHFT